MATPETLMSFDLVFAALGVLYRRPGGKMKTVLSDPDKYICKVIEDSFHARKGRSFYSCRLAGICPLDLQTWCDKYSISHYVVGASDLSLVMQKTSAKRNTRRALVYRVHGSWMGLIDVNLARWVVDNERLKIIWRTKGVVFTYDWPPTLHALLGEYGYRWVGDGLLWKGVDSMPVQSPLLLGQPDVKISPHHAYHAHTRQEDV